MGIIAFDARNVGKERTGIGRVAESLIRNLVRLDHENEYLLIQRAALEAPIVSDPRIRVVHVPYGIASLHNAFFFCRMLRQYQPAVYHSLHSFLPFGVPQAVKTVVTVHDFNWIQRPAIAAPVPWKGWANSLYGRPMHAQTVRAANHLVCVSRQTKQDLLSLYPNTPKPVSVIHNGVNPDALTSGEVRANVRRYRECRFVLSVGNGRPYKNPEGTLRAFAEIKREPRHADIRLLMVGRGDRTAQLQAFAQVAGIGSDVNFVGIVSDAELAFLMQHALLLSFPSRWEGFGLPVIEAFAFGCPVIASSVGSLTEVASGAAWMIDDPDSVRKLAAAMRTIINNEAVRERLRRDGLKRAAKFTWDNAAHAYLDIYKQLTADLAFEPQMFALDEAGSRRREKPRRPAFARMP